MEETSNEIVIEKVRIDEYLSGDNIHVPHSENKIVTVEDAANAFLQEAGARYLCSGGAHVNINQRTTEYMNNLLKSPHRLSRTSHKYDSYNDAISIKKLETVIECFALGRELVSFLEDKTYLPRHLDVFFNK